MTVVRYAKWQDVPIMSVGALDPKAWPWAHFAPRELACPHCFALVIDPEALDRLEAARLRYGAPITVASAYRCPAHPIEVAKAEAARAAGIEQYDGGAHTRGAAFDPYPAAGGNLRDMIGALMLLEPHGFGMGLRDGRLHLHVDWDAALGRRAWGY